MFTDLIHLLCSLITVYLFTKFQLYNLFNNRDIDIKHSLFHYQMVLRYQSCTMPIFALQLTCIQNFNNLAHTVIGIWLWTTFWTGSKLKYVLLISLKSGHALPNTSTLSISTTFLVIYVCKPLVNRFTNGINRMIVYPILSLDIINVPK